MLPTVRIAGVAVGIWLTGIGLTCAANDARSEYAKGQARLADGDLRGALQAYVAAVKSDRDNQEYIQQYMLVRQAVALDNALSREEDPGQWEVMAQALRSFFIAQNLPAQSLPIDREIFRRLKSADAAVQLAETLLSLNQSEEAVRVLETVDSRRATLGSRALLAVALARQERIEEAQAVQASLVMPVSGETDPGTLYLLARMQAALGDQAGAISTLQRCFESVPPSRLDTLKSHAKTCADFASLASLASFTSVLRTESKVPESKCSGGSSCGSCPMRSGCGKTQNK
jgi:tetratricopeptide (TPR) repeat protein